MTRFLPALRPTILVCAVMTSASASPPPTTPTQSLPTAVQETQFEVASIKPDDPRSPWPGTNLDLDASDYFRYQSGPVTADGYLVNYIIFAYKLPSSGAYKLLDSQLPKWAQINSLQRFHLEATAGDHPTKDTLRLMVRSLLAERFGLKVHTETRQQTAWVLEKTGAQPRTPQLRPHTSGPICTTITPAMAQPAKPPPGVIPPYCGSLVLREEEGIHLRVQDYTMPQIAGELSMIAGASLGDELPAVDGTRMTGHFDLDLHFAGKRKPGEPEQDATAQAPDILQAMYAQAGLEFRKKAVPIELLIVDHVHEPTPD